MIDNDDEDDYEGYFLRPANEYNIKEKIKLANQESFAIPTPPSPKFNIGERRVTFREQLVDYEPDEFSDAEEEEGYSGSNGIANDESESSPELNDRSQSKNTTGDMDEVDEDIIEELSINDTAEDEIESRVENVPDDDDQEEDDEEEEANEEEEEEEEEQGREEEQEQDEELDEEVTESSLDTEIHNPETSEDSSSPTKARTSEEGSASGDGPDVNYSEESQNDEDNSEEREILKEQLMRESLSYDIEGEDEEQCTEDRGEDDESTGRDSPLQAHLRERSAKCKRKCCRYKKTISEKLPYYNGLHSEYGLSKKELDAKQKRVEAKKKRFYERHQKKAEEQQIKAQTNEEAFASWLNKKLKNSINKYQNMYDYKGKKHKQRLSKEGSVSMAVN